MVKNMKKIILISIIVLIILIFAIVGVFAYLYFGTDTLKSNKQMYLKYFAESKDLIYNQLKDEDLDNYKKKLKNTPYENNGKISIIYDTEASNKTNEMQDSNIVINGKVDKLNKINSQNLKINIPQTHTTDIDLIAQDDIYGFKINNILKSYITIENNNLQEWAKDSGLSEDQIKLIPNKFDSTFFDSIISEDEMNHLIEKYTKLLVNNLNEDMFSKTTQNNTTIYSLKMNETQLKSIAKNIIQMAKDDESIWQIIRKIYTGFSNYSEDEINKQIDELKKQLEDYIANSIDDEDIENVEDTGAIGDINEDDVFGNTTTDTSKEDKIYVYNLYIENGKLVKTEAINDDQSQTISKTENGLLIEKKEKDYSGQEEITTLTIEKNKEEEKLIYNIEMLYNSELIGSMSIGYRGLGSLNQVEEIATCSLNTFEELDNGIFKRAQGTRNKSSEEKEEIMIAIQEIYNEKMNDLFIGNNTNNDTNISLDDLKSLFSGKNFEISENGDGTFRIISKDTKNEYTVSSNGKVETKESQTEENVDTTNPKRKIQYYNKNTFNDNLQIKKIEDNEMWKINGKDAKQIGNVIENITTKMEELNKGQMQNNVSSYENKSKADIIILGLIPYFSIVGIDNIEYEQITVKNATTAYVEAFVGLISAQKVMFNNFAADVINNPYLQQETNIVQNSR